VYFLSFLPVFVNLFWMDERGMDVRVVFIRRF
jgi:hypothetical protein